MKVIWQSVAPWYPSGYGTQTNECLKILQELGHDVIVSTYYGLKDGGYITYRGVPIHPAEKGWGSESTRLYYKRFKADVVISLMDIWPLPNGYGRDINWYPYHPIDHSPVPPAVLHRLEYAKRPIVYSKFGVNEYAKLGVESLYVPHTIDTEVFKPTNDKLSFFNDKTDFLMGCVAVNRGKRKNMEGLLMAFADFIKIHPEAILYMHTQGSGFDVGDYDLHALCSFLDILDNVYFSDDEEYHLGMYSSEWVNQLYNTIDVFVLPSKGEGFGLPIAEAQAAGCPVIVTNATSMPELVGGGWLLDCEKEWTYQSSWQFLAPKEEILRGMELAYQAKKDGSILDLKKKSREHALQYAPAVVTQQWKKVLEQIEEETKHGIPHVIHQKKVAKITLTNKCNAKCVTCLTPNIPKEEQGVMTKENFTKICENICKSSFIGYVSLNSIGELFTIKNYKDILADGIKILKEKNLRIGITTNGELSKPLDVDDYIVSFNGYDKASFENTTGLNFEKTYENIVKLSKIQKGIQIHYLSMDADEEHEQMFFNLFKDLDIPLRVSRKVENQFGLLDRPSLTRYQCNYLDMININWNGDVIQCAHDFGGKEVFGNALENEWKEIIQSHKRLTKILEHKESIFTGLCENCNYNTLLKDRVFYYKAAEEEKV